MRGSEPFCGIGEAVYKWGTVKVFVRETLKNTEELSQNLVVGWTSKEECAQVSAKPH